LPAPVSSLGALTETLGLALSTLATVLTPVETLPTLSAIVKV